MRRASRCARTESWLATSDPAAGAGWVNWFACRRRPGARLPAHGASAPCRQSRCNWPTACVPRAAACCRWGAVPQHDFVCGQVLLDALAQSPQAQNWLTKARQRPRLATRSEGIRPLSGPASTRGIVADSLRSSAGRGLGHLKVCSRCWLVQEFETVVRRKSRPDWWMREMHRSHELRAWQACRWKQT